LQQRRWVTDAIRKGIERHLGWLSIAHQNHGGSRNGGGLDSSSIALRHTVKQGMDRFKDSVVLGLSGEWKTRRGEQGEGEHARADHGEDCSAKHRWF
jgi:hypothetical protein